MSSSTVDHPAIRSARARGMIDAESARGPSRAGWLTVVVAVLCFLGLVMVLSSSSVQAIDDTGSTWGYFLRQTMWTVLGAAVCAVMSRIDYRHLRRFAPPLLGVTVAMLLVVLVPGLGLHRNGSRRWLGVGAFTVQPSELAKLTLLLFLADVLARRASQVSDKHATLYPSLIITGVVATLVLVEPDLGTTIVLGSIAAAVLWVHGIPLRWMATLSVGGIAATAALGMSASYRRDRMLAVLDPWSDPQNTGYQTIQSLLGLGHGGLFGVGLGASRAKWGFLPNAHTDFIYAVIGEELGLVGTVGVLALFLGFGYLGIRISLAAPDHYGRLLAAGITAWVMAQAFINMGTVIGIVPVTGVPLPFVSFGGTALVVTLAAIGVLLNVARQAERPATATATATATAGAGGAGGTSAD